MASLCTVTKEQEASSKFAGTVVGIKLEPQHPMVAFLCSICVNYDHKLFFNFILVITQQAE